MSGGGRLRDELTDKNAEIDALRMQVKLLKESQPNANVPTDIKELILNKQKLSAEVDKIKFDLEQERANNAKNKRHIRDLNATLERYRSSNQAPSMTSSALPTTPTPPHLGSEALISRIPTPNLSDSSIPRNGPLPEFGTPPVSPPQPPTPSCQTTPPLSLTPPPTPLSNISTPAEVLGALQCNPSTTNITQADSSSQSTEDIKQVQLRSQELEQSLQRMRAEYEMNLNPLNSRYVSCEQQIQGIHSSLGAKQVLLDEATAGLNASRAILESTKQQLSASQNELERLKVDIEPKRQLETRLQGMEADRGALEKQLASSHEQQQRLAEELGTAQTTITALMQQNAQFHTEVSSLRTKLEETQTMVQSTRSKKDLSRDKDFHDRFPDLPATELLIDYFSCSYGMNPGYLYLSQSYLCFEALITGGSHITCPLKAILSVNQVKLRLIPGKASFQISLDDGKVHTFHGVSNLRHLVKTMVTQARNASHIIIPLKEGKAVDPNVLE
ncbi:GRAM domain-containing protein 4 [Pelomyxa schiedti]|nr:GRAM domain-containing protein 4 [Pelomyxa schiedti]